MIIGFVRHGKTEWNALGRIQGQTDIPLNETGLAQARALAQRLSDDNTEWDAILSSDLERARETARVISGKLDIPLLEADTRLRERFYGDIEGTTEQERLERWGVDWRSAEAGQESDADVRARGRMFLEECYRTNPNGKILLVSHGSFLAQMFTELCSGLNTQYINNMSYSILEFNEGQWNPLLYNCTRHLNE
ncbi:MAG: histidine phosphatase family protein [Candidatus Pristimantibacillus sp.]